MLLFKQVKALQRFLRSQKKAGQTIGFVPTMGALHEGHLALVRKARSENNLSVCSIFVNPTQFNEASDLDAYPRLPGPDLEGLSRVGNDVVLMPSDQEVYPNGRGGGSPVDLAGLDQPMEGAFRPGHFAGVAQVVNRLLDIVEPHRLYMGQKDYQQAAIIRHLLRETGRPTELRVQPTVREADGLAMSSRNLRLTSDHRDRANKLYETLQWVRDEYLSGQPVKQIERAALEKLDQPGFRPEYLQIVDGITLKPAESTDQHDVVVACVACWAGEVRLIDNLILKDN